MKDLSKVLKAYSGKAGKCRCGCAGKYVYPTAKQEQAGKDRGFSVDVVELSDRSVKRIYNKVLKHIAEAEDCHTWTDVRIGNRDYTVYYVAE
jgi:hypothetical protein